LACTIWFVTAVSGVFLVNVFGVFQSQSFTLKTVNQLLPMKRLRMLQIFSVNMVPMFGSKEKQKTDYQKDLRMKVARMVSSQKKRILWTFGLTQDHLTKVYLKNAMIYNSQLIYI